MELYRPTFFKHWRCFLDPNSYTRQAVWLGCGGYSFVCRYLRITKLLSAPLVLRIGDWLCVLPAIILVVDKSKKVSKAVSSSWLVVNCLTPKIEGSNSLPSWQRWEAIVYRVQYTFDTSDMSNITLYTVLCKSCKHHLIAFDFFINNIVQCFTPPTPLTCPFIFY